MKYNIIEKLLILLVVSWGGIFCSCSDDDTHEVQQIASKLQISISKYHNSEGTTTQHKWKVDDQVAILFPEANQQPASFAQPIRSGGTQSLFLYMFEAPVNRPTTLVGVYPYNDQITCSENILTTYIPTQQNGEVSPYMIGRGVGVLNSYEGCQMELKELAATLYIQLKKGNYTIQEMVLKSNNGEKIAGHYALNVAEWNGEGDSSEITITPQEALDCSRDSRRIAVKVAPVMLSQGFTITLTDSDGKTFDYVESSPVEFRQGERFDTEPISSSYLRELIICGDNMVYYFDADLALKNGYKDAITWSWNAETIADIIGKPVARCNHIDECKPVNNGKQLLITSSYGWTVLLDVKTQEVVFYSSLTPNAHSAELLPNGRLVVATSSGDSSRHNSIHLYDVNKSNEILSQYPLDYAHGAVWNEVEQRLYTVGNQAMNIYSLEAWETEAPKLKLEKIISTPFNSVHDLTYVDEHTLCVAGWKCYLFNTQSEKFTEMMLFKNSTSLKSVNFNKDTGEVWYTDSTIPEGTQTWSTQTIGYATDINGTGPAATIKTLDMDLYKVRVNNW